MITVEAVVRSDFSLDFAAKESLTTQGISAATGSRIEVIHCDKPPMAGLMPLCMVLRVCLPKGLWDFTRMPRGATA